MKEKNENIKKYWEERADKNRLNPQKATTDDFWLKKLEIREIKKILTKIKHKKDVLDIGCGDGFSTISIAKSFPKINFLGGDYAEGMLKNAKLLAKKMHCSIGKKINFTLLDVSNINLNKKFDVIISDRCLINMPNKSMQLKALKQIYGALKRGGHYIMVENFIEGHNKMNELRKKLAIKEIPVRWHNLFFDDKFLKNNILKLFSLEKRENISSLYYLITRVLYSKICQIENKEPAYDNIFYEVAIKLEENCGNFGPINLLLLKKK